MENNNNNMNVIGNPDPLGQEQPPFENMNRQAM